MNLLINRILQLKNWEIFIIFLGTIFIPMPGNFMESMFGKFLLIIILQFGYFWVIYNYIHLKLVQINVPHNFNLYSIFILIRAISLGFFPFFLILDSVLKSKRETEKELFSIVLIGGIILISISFVLWFLFVRFLGQSLNILESNLESKKSIDSKDSFGYAVAFWFIPIGIFIVQPILNRLYKEFSKIE
jgi:hypothetical protein